MATLNLTDEQVIDLLKQLPVDRRKKILAVVDGDELARKESTKKLRQLLRKTQALPQIKEITDEEIAAEIAAYRAGH
jgi:hypothetical protein